MWITFPQKMWKSKIHRFFIIGMWITFCLQELQIKVLHKSSELSTILASLSTSTCGKILTGYPQPVDNVDNFSTKNVEKSCSDTNLSMTMIVSLSKTRKLSPVCG